MYTLNMFPINISTLYAISQYYFTPSIYLMHIPTDLDAPKRVHHLALFFIYFCLSLFMENKSWLFICFLIILIIKIQLQFTDINSHLMKYERCRQIRWCKLSLLTKYFLRF